MFLGDNMHKTVITIDFSPIGGGVIRSGLGFQPVLTLLAVVLIGF